MVLPNWLTDCLNIQYLQEQILLEVGDGDFFPVRRTQLFAAPSVVLAPTIQSRWGWVSWWRARGSFHNTHCQPLPSLLTTRGAVKIYFPCCCDILSQTLIDPVNDFWMFTLLWAKFCIFLSGSSTNSF